MQPRSHCWGQERQTQSSECQLRPTSIPQLLKRLRPDTRHAPFQYRMAVSEWLSESTLTDDFRVPRHSFAIPTAAWKSAIARK